MTKLKPGTAGTVEGDEIAHTAVLKIEAIGSAMERFVDDLDKVRMDDHERKVIDHIVMSIEMLEDQCDALRVALWGEGRSP